MSLPRIYPLIFKNVFSHMDAEKAHHFGFNAIKAAEKTGAGALLRKATAPDPVLARTVMGLDFPTPFGLAAGFDKGGDGTTALLDIGFGHVEVGTITGQPQPGNPTPRLFRLPADKALINRMGFNNDGAAVIASRLMTSQAKLAERNYRTRPIIGVNIGKTKVVELADAAADYEFSTRRLAMHADYMVVNVSSPNTPGLRQLQEISSLEPLLAAVQRTADEVTGRRVPLLVKIAPDLADEDVKAVAQLVLKLDLAGVVATNTTISRAGLSTDPHEVEQLGAGGVSGLPVKERSMEVLRLLRAELPTEKAIISVGGVTTATDVYARLVAGADLVQGYTAFLYEGPMWAHRINTELAMMLKAQPIKRG
ncbi:quinone-dependent dihydroorotate dehydrogenase [Micrococcoides hystricis]|uniref:Dihydroorotate dehydrogenase (quinone) n=1 Tax=Micrococcoides hystricis TaxID=1572761 RepID=A0ABV6P7C6_9MICC